MQFAFEDLVLDDETFELRRGDELVPVEPKVFDVLAYLISHRDRVVEKTELLERVWGDQFVSDSTLSTRIKQARQAVADDGRAQRVIKTSHGRGFRFVAPVDVVTDDGSDGADRAGGDGADGGGGSKHRLPSGSNSLDLGAAAVHRPRAVDLLGREDEVAAIERRLVNRRLVTLVGMGGIGKTHLLHHVGGHLGHRYDDGAVAVELAPVRSSAAVGASLLEALGGGDPGGFDPRETAIHWLRPRRLLLLIDNAEHVTRDVAELCREIIRDCAGVDLLVTSRERLNVVGESVQPIGPLDEAASISLFVERAFDAGVEIDPDHREVGELCRRLDGVPLAVEIMAARAPLLSVTDLASDLDRHLAATLPSNEPRHQTLEATLRWSFDGLAELERRLLEDLTVFAGSFDLVAAEAVSEVDDVTEPLLDLCRRSLVVPSPEPGGSRFRLLEPVRLFAAASNVALDEARSRHAEHYLTLAERADRLMTSPAIDEGLALLGTEWRNLRAAFVACEAAGEVGAMARQVNATANYAEARVLTEVHQWAERAVAAAQQAGLEPDPVLVANLARFSVHHGGLDRMNLLLAGIDRDHPSNHVRMALIVRAWYRGEVDETFALLDRALDDVAGEKGYWELTFALLRAMSSVIVDERPTHLLDRLQTLAEVGGWVAQLFGRIAGAIRLLWADRWEAAIVELDAAVLQAESEGAAGFAQLAHNLRVQGYRSLGDPVRAAAVAAESIRRNVEAGGRSLVVECLGSAAVILADGGRPTLAVEVLAARQAAGYRFGGQAEDRFRGRLERSLGHESFAAHEDRGSRMSLPAVIDRVLDGLAEVSG